ncbi:MAG: PP2C family protein-serine/threonine phosphatase [Planctomycetota bacterium]
MKTSPDTSQVMFRREYEHELETWVRRRFNWLCGAFVALGAVKVLWGIVILANLSRVGGGSRTAAAILVTVTGAAWLVVVGVFFARRRRYETREDLLGSATWMILVLGAVSLAARFVVEWLAPAMTSDIITAIFYLHLTSGLFLPWTPRDSLRPILPLLAVWAVHTLFVEMDKDLVARLLWVLFSPGILLPGLMICGWRLKRHSRQFRSVMMGRHFRTMRQEFTRARTIHESLFPAEYEDGHVRFQYTYEPMRELGGDFLHIHVGPEGFVHLTVIDVTGHGLAAALTVNRIYGELERIRAESPRINPGELLYLLNHYLRLTMVKHNIYATAIAVTLDPYIGEVRWANAGHPPGFLRGANGAVRGLDSTAIVLGAVSDDDFSTDEKCCELSPGDVVVLYTDGAFEARDHLGRQLGLDRLQELLHGKPSPGNWPQFITAAVDKHQVGHAEDDVLVAALTFTAVRPQRQMAKPAMAES